LLLFLSCLTGSFMAWKKADVPLEFAANMSWTVGSGVVLKGLIPCDCTIAGCGDFAGVTTAD
jgi:hypothetical protein